MRLEWKANITSICLSFISVLLVIAFWGLYLKINNLSVQIEQLRQGSGHAPPENLGIGTNAPDFLLISTQNEKISLENFRGTRTLLVFYSPTCSACQKMLPNIKEISNRIQTVLVSYGTSEENQQFVGSENISFKVLNWEESVAAKYKVSATPTFFLIDKDLRIENSGFVDNSNALEIFCKLAR